MYPVALSGIEVRLKLILCLVYSKCCVTAAGGPGFYVSHGLLISCFCLSYIHFAMHTHVMHHVFVTYRPDLLFICLNM
jgi:hypothetical protein